MHGKFSEVRTGGYLPHKQRMQDCCEIRRQLADQFSISARLYAEAVVNLAVSSISQEEYIRLCRRAKDAQRRAEAASVAFEEHVDLHRCFNSSPEGSNTASGRRMA
jgi:hypothetical protein